MEASQIKKRKDLLYLSLIVTSIFAVLDFLLMDVYPRIMFFIHNSIAIVFGVILIVASYKLIKGRAGAMIINQLVMITGTGMIVIHSIFIARFLI
jgi:hypothetical protein